jgi:hypothetical protein
MENPGLNLTIRIREGRDMHFVSRPRAREMFGKASQPMIRTLARSVEPITVRAELRALTPSTT